MPAKKGASPVMAVDKLHVPSSALVPSADEQSNSPRSPSRRNFLRRGSTIAGSAFAAGATGISMSQAEPLTIPPSNLGYGKPIPETANRMYAAAAATCSRTGRISPTGA